MADITPYKLSMTSLNADKGIKTGLAISTTSGIILSDGQGGVKSAVPGTDYGMPLLTGNGAPTASTVGNLGQHYFDMMATAAPYEYICVGYTAAGFVWRIYGDSGTNFAPRGHFISVDELNSAIADGIIAEPTPGVAYYIGTDTPYDVYVFDEVTNDWINTGPLGGSSGGSSTTGIPPHGSEGQALFKLSDADYDVVWANLVDYLVCKAANYGAKSIPTSAYADGSVTRAKLATDALYSPIVFLGGDVDISANHCGKTLYASYNSNSKTYTVTLNQTISTALPNGFEVAFVRAWASNKLEIVVEGIRVILHGEGQVTTVNKGAEFSIDGQGGMAALKKVSSDANVGDVWLITGNVEVVT